MHTLLLLLYHLQAMFCVATSNLKGKVSGLPTALLTFNSYCCRHVINFDVPLQVSPSDCRACPRGQLQMKLPTVLEQSCWHPPLLVAHSSMSVEVLIHAEQHHKSCLVSQVHDYVSNSNKLIHNKSGAGSINYLPTQLLPSSKSEYPFIQEQK